MRRLALTRIMCRMMLMLPPPQYYHNDGQAKKPIGVPDKYLLRLLDILNTVSSPPERLL